MPLARIHSLPGALPPRPLGVRSKKLTNFRSAFDGNVTFVFSYIKIILCMTSSDD